MSPSIDVRNHKKTRILTINNPAKRNAFSGSMATDLGRLLTEADQDVSVRCIVIVGVGESSFSSGHDLQEMLENPRQANDADANAAFSLPSRIGTPVIAALNAAAYAAGFILALSCDLRIAAQNSSLCAVGVKIGMVPVGGQISRILNLVSYSEAFRMVTTGQPVSADDAFQSGLVTEVCPQGSSLETALAYADVIAAASPAAVRAAKMGLNETLRYGLDHGYAAETRLAQVVSALPDSREGIEAFFGKRAPNYPDQPADLAERLTEVLEHNS